MTVRTREASSIDFKKLFSAIARELLGDGNCRLVIVIDNLDRVDAANAVGMWTTMRTFFEFGDADWNQRLWLIVPFDRSALRKLWKSDDEANGNHASEELLESFLNKTFQVVFHLSPLLVMKLREYFEKQMRLAFDDATVDRHFDTIYRIHGLLRPSSPSPRQVKTFLNKLCAQNLLWSSAGDKRVELPFLAVHLLMIDSLVEKPGDLIHEDFLDIDVVNVLNQASRDPQSGTSKDWRQQIAAAHFNVDADSALQMLLFGRFTKAFQSGKFDDLRAVAQQPYFPLVFKSYLDGQHDDWRKGTIGLAHAMRFLHSSATTLSPADARTAWRELLADMAEGTPWSPLTSAHLEAFDAAVANSHYHPDAFGPILDRTVNALSNMTSTNLAGWLPLVENMLASLQKFNIDLGTLKISVGDISVLVRAHRELIENKSRSGARRVLVPFTRDGIPASFVAEAGTITDTSEFVDLRESLASYAKVPLADLNAAILASSIDIRQKLAFLLTAPVQAGAEITADEIKALTFPDSAGPNAHKTAAYMALGDQDGFEGANKVTTFGNIFIDELGTDLLAWNQAGAIFNPLWYQTGLSTMMTELLQWLVTKNRVGAIPIGPLARIYPAIHSAQPTLAASLLNDVAARVDLVEALK